MSPYYVYPSPECAAATAQVTPAPEVAPQVGTSSRRASSTKRKAKKRRAAAAAKGKSSRKRTKKSTKRSRRKARGASLSVLAAASGIAGAASLGTRSGHSAASLGTPGFFGCVLVDGR
jgi:hypothetical protein